MQYTGKWVMYMIDIYKNNMNTIRYINSIQLYVICKYN